MYSKGLAGRPPAPDAQIDAIASAIDRMEGPGIQRNNPGNIRAWGSLPTEGGFAVFPTEQAGWEALYRQISLNRSRGLTLEEFFGGKPGIYGGYAPAGDGSNRPSQYAANVSAWAGIPLGVPISAAGAFDGSAGAAAGEYGFLAPAPGVAVGSVALLAGGALALYLLLR